LGSSKEKTIMDIYISIFARIGIVVILGLLLLGLGITGLILGILPIVNLLSALAMIAGLVILLVGFEMARAYASRRRKAHG
jgi:ABC-type transport system involved in cytochrome c biogenesis permease subunit